MINILIIVTQTCIILDFNYEPDLDNTKGDLFNLVNTPIINNTDNTQEYTTTFDHTNLQKFNNQRIKSSYYKTYTICNNTLDMSTVNATKAVLYITIILPQQTLEKLFHVLVCGGNDASTGYLTTEAYKKLNEQITDDNVNYIYNKILYSSNYLKWIYDLKDSHDKITELSSS